jgi:hypothetical protein
MFAALADYRHARWDSSRSFPSSLIRSKRIRHAMDFSSIRRTWPCGPPCRRPTGARLRLLVRLAQERRDPGAPVGDGRSRSDANVLRLTPAFSKTKDGRVIPIPAPLRTVSDLWHVSQRKASTSANASQQHQELTGRSASAVSFRSRTVRCGSGTVWAQHRGQRRPVMDRVPSPLPLPTWSQTQAREIGAACAPFIEALLSHRPSIGRQTCPPARPALRRCPPTGTRDAHPLSE